MPPRRPPAQDGAPSVADIIVTANKRAENLQKVPISIAAFTAKAIDTQGIKSVVDLPQLTPGLGFTRTLVGTNAFLRGVGTTSAGYSTESPIATYVDGLYMPNSAASSFSFNNIERIEVLKGPQGTLYGRNTTKRSDPCDHQGAGRCHQRRHLGQLWQLQHGAGQFLWLDAAQ
jgi:iron complex outermembrane receptor protein